MLENIVMNYKKSINTNIKIKYLQFTAININEIENITDVSK